jgi:hypothetical protein
MSARRPQESIVSKVEEQTSDEIDVGFRVVDELAALIKAETVRANRSAKTVVTAALRRGLASVQQETGLTIGAIARDAGFTQFHAHLRHDEIDALDSLRVELEKVLTRKVPFRHVLRELLHRGLSAADT